jgi:dihydroorotase
MTLEDIGKVMSDKPRQRFGITSDPGFTVFDLSCEYDIDPESFKSMGRSTPFKGVRVFGKCLATVYEGKAVYLDESCK